MKHTTFRMILRREKKPSENSCPTQSSGGNRDNSLGFSNACFVVWLLLPEGRAEAWTLAHTKPELWLQCCSPSVVYSGPFQWAQILHAHSAAKATGGMLHLHVSIRVHSHGCQCKPMFMCTGVTHYTANACPALHPWLHRRTQMSKASTAAYSRLHRLQPAGLQSFGSSSPSQKQ